MTEKNRPQFEVFQCEQGFTLRESAGGQLMHSQVGPVAEARTIYLASSDLEGRLAAAPELRDAPLVIYDVGMGIAANAIAAIEKFKRLCALGSVGRNLLIVSFEKYPEALAQAVALASLQSDAFEYLAPYENEIAELLNRGFVSFDFESNASHSVDDSMNASGKFLVEWRWVTGDFESVDLAELPRPDLIYFDFYSPQTCPELWTVEIFERLRRVSQRGVALITYSVAKSVRSAILLAGFAVGHGPSTSMKKETTIARMDYRKLSAPLASEWLESLRRSSRPFPSDILPRDYKTQLEKISMLAQFSR